MHLIKEDGKGSDFAVQEFTIGAWVNPNDVANNTIWSYDHSTHVSPYYAQQFDCCLRVKFISLGITTELFKVYTQLQTTIPRTSGYVTAVLKAGEQKIYIDGSVVGTSSVSLLLFITIKNLDWTK